MWLLILYDYTILCFYFTFFLLLRPPRDKFYYSKRLIRFNYNLPPSNITIFQTESFNLLNWKVSQLKCISLIKLTSTLNTLFLLEWNFFHWEKGWNEWRRQCTKSALKVHKKVHKKFFYYTDIYVCDDFAFLFHFFAIWLSVKFKGFFIIKTLFQIFHVFVLLYKDKLKVQHESATCLLCTNMLHFYVALFLGRS